MNPDRLVGHRCPVKGCDGRAIREGDIITCSEYGTEHLEHKEKRD